MKFYIFATKGISLVSRLIRLYQWGYPFTHIGIVSYLNNFINPYIKEFFPFVGYREGYLYDLHTKHTPFIVYSINVTKEQLDKITELIEYIKHNNNGYDYLGVLGFLTRDKDLQTPNRYFCSEFVFTVLKEAGIELLKDTKPAEVSPRLFLKSPLLNFEYYYDGYKFYYDEEKAYAD